MSELLTVTSPHEHAAKRKVFLPMSPVQVSSPGTWRPPPPSQKSTTPVVPPSVSLSLPPVVPPLVSVSLPPVVAVVAVVASLALAEVVGPVLSPAVELVDDPADPDDVVDSVPSLASLVAVAPAVDDDVGSVALAPEEKPEVVALVSSPPEQAARPTRATRSARRGRGRGAEVISLPVRGKAAIG